MKKIISFALIILLTQMFFVHQVFAETKEEKFTGKVRTEITKLGTGPDAKIQVKLRDGKKIKGYVTEADENQFVVMNLKTGQTIPVAYERVKQVKGNNLSKGVIITIGIVGFLVLIFVLAANAS